MLVICVFIQTEEQLDVSPLLQPYNILPCCLNQSAIECKKYFHTYRLPVYVYFYLFILGLSVTILPSHVFLH